LITALSPRASAGVDANRIAAVMMAAAGTSILFAY
jgi:hypothetical protein